MNNIQENNIDQSNQNNQDNKKQVKSLLQLALEVLYDLDIQVESLKDEIPLTLLREYEKYKEFRDKLKLEQLQKEKAIQLCNQIGNRLSLIGDELLEFTTSKQCSSKNLVKLVGSIINASYIFMKAVDNQLL